MGGSVGPAPETDGTYNKSAILPRRSSYSRPYRGKGGGSILRPCAEVRGPGEKEEERRGEFPESDEGLGERSSRTSSMGPSCEYWLPHKPVASPPDYSPATGAMCWDLPTCPTPSKKVCRLGAFSYTGP